MGSRQRRLEALEFVVAVRERHHGPAGEEALQARLALAGEYLDAEMVDDALEMLLGAVMDAGRLYGPNDERTWQTRLRLGLAYEAADRLHDAYGHLWNLDADARATPDAGAEILDQVRTEALRVEAALDHEDAS